MRKGLLGGTFDPIHNGHVVLAQEAMVGLGLEGLWFVPTGSPWMKQGAALSAKEDRRAMVELAIAEEPRFHVCHAELDREGVTYTVDTLEELLAGEMTGDELWFIMGSDTLETMHEWKDPKRILELARVAVALRPRHEKLDLRKLERVAPGAAERVTVIRLPLMSISGTEVRRRAAAGESLAGLVPEGVAAYIVEHGLYGGARLRAAASGG